jgi:hypothetical protein
LKEKFMTVTKLLGVAAVGAMLAMTATSERAQAMSLASPGAAAAVAQGASAQTTEVRWHRHWHPRRHWHPHRWHRGHRHHWWAVAHGIDAIIWKQTGPHCGPVVLQAVLSLLVSWVRSAVIQASPATPRRI